MGLGEHVTGENDGWCTDDSVLAPLHQNWPGGVGLDPCGNPASVFARHTILLPEYANIEPIAAPTAQTITFADGLYEPWEGHGLCFQNPPFSYIPPWLERSVIMANDFGVESILLMPARVNAQYLHTIAFASQGASGLLIPDRRIKFKNAKTQPPWHTIFLYFGPRPKLFKEVFGDLFGMTLGLRPDSARDARKEGYLLA
jgi:hypothetical protein